MAGRAVVAIGTKTIGAVLVMAVVEVKVLAVAVVIPVEVVVGEDMESGVRAMIVGVGRDGVGVLGVACGLELEADGTREGVGAKEEESKGGVREVDG